MPDTITGARGTGNILAGRKVRDVDDKIAYWEPSADPYTSISRKLNGKRKVENQKFEWQEDQQVPHYDTINNSPGPYATDATEFVFDHDYIRAGDILLHPTGGEYVRVTSFDTTTHTATVVRNFGEVGLVTWADGLEVLIICDVNEEGSTSVSDITTKLTQPYNYTQIIKTKVDITGTEAETKLYGGGDEKTQLAKALIRHKMKIERAMIFGKRNLIAGTTHNIGSMGGLLNWITSNISAVGSTFTEYELEALIETLSVYNMRKEYTLFMGARGISVVNGWAKDKIRLIDKMSKENEYGFSYAIYNSAHGRIEMVEHNQLSDSYSGYGIALNMENVRYAYLKNRDTHLQKNIQANDYDGVQHQWLSEVSQEVKLEFSHGVFTGIVG